MAAFLLFSSFTEAPGDPAPRDCPRSTSWCHLEAARTQCLCRLLNEDSELLRPTQCSGTHRDSG